MYGDHSGFAEVAGGAELLVVISLHAAELRSGKLEAVLRWRVRIDDAARHRADPYRGQRHAAINCGLGHLWTRFGTCPAS